MDEMVINPHYIPLRNINGIHWPSCFTDEETDQRKAWLAATRLSDFPASLPVSKTHHEQKNVTDTFIISIHSPSSKTSRLLTMACNKAHHCPALPTSQTLWPSPHPLSTTLPSRTIFLSILPTGRPCPYHSGSCDSVTFTSRLKWQALPSPLSTSPPYRSLISPSFSP